MNTSPKKRLFFGWYILTASFLLLFFQSGARFSFGVMFKPMITELGWSRASMSFAFFLNMSFFALTMSVGGRLYDRYGPKWVIFLSSALLSIGFAGISFIDDDSDVENVVFFATILRHCDFGYLER